MTTQEGIKQIKDNMNVIEDWKKINELIPEAFNKSVKSKKVVLPQSLLQVWS